MEKTNKELREKYLKICIKCIFHEKCNEDDVICSALFEWEVHDQLQKSLENEIQRIVLR